MKFVCVDDISMVISSRWICSNKENVACPQEAKCEAFRHMDLSQAQVED